MEIKDRQDLDNMRAMLEGNLNRMNITENIFELEQMYDFSKRRLEALYQYARNNFLKKMEK